MIRHIKTPSLVKAEGTVVKLIEEFIGRASTGTEGVSVARMRSPGGWIEPGQLPEFDEYSIVLRGSLRVQTREGTFDVRAGEAIVAPRGEWVRYSTPTEEGAEYIAVCIPAFSPETVNREEE